VTTYHKRGDVLHTRFQATYTASQRNVEVAKGTRTMRLFRRSRGCIRVTSKVFSELARTGEGAWREGRGRVWTRRWWWYENKMHLKLRPPLPGYVSYDGIVLVLVRPTFY
jgi:hypothetical protein